MTRNPELYRFDGRRKVPQNRHLGPLIDVVSESFERGEGIHTHSYSRCETGSGSLSVTSHPSVRAR